MISTRGRYALRIMLDLAKAEEGKYVSLKSVAERQEMSMKYLESIISLLNKGGIVVSLRGTQGGYRLARPAEEITVYEVIRLTEGPLAPVSCLEAGGPEGVSCTCAQEDSCQTLPLWRELERRVRDYLETVTIRDLAEGRVTGD